ncbi:hypothetical protein B0H21DRAFT_747586, partial [Amylocystis lapponica]
VSSIVRLTICLEYLQVLYHPTAVCDRCMTRITGVWYRCAYCSRDLCEVCEEMDTHNRMHVFVVFKSPVDMHLLRYVSLRYIECHA